MKLKTKAVGLEFYLPSKTSIRTTRSKVQNIKTWNWQKFCKDSWRGGGQRRGERRWPRRRGWVTRESWGLLKVETAYLESGRAGNDFRGDCYESHEVMKLWSYEVALRGKQVHLGCLLGVLSSSCNFNSSTPRGTWAESAVYLAWTRSTWAESAK